MTQHRQPNSGLAGTRLAYESQHLAWHDVERDLLDNRLASGRDNAQLIDCYSGDRPAQSGRRVRSMPAAARAMPSPIKPVPIVSRATAVIGSTTPQGCTTRATWFSWIMSPQSRSEE